MFEARPENSPANFTLYPLACLAVCFALGISAAHFLDLSWQIYFASCLIFAALATAFLKKSFCLIFLLAAFAAVGGLYYSAANQPLADNRLKKLYDEGRIKSGDPIEIEGVLEGKPELAVGGFFLEIKTQKAIYKNSEFPVSGKIRFFAGTENENFAAEYERLNLQSGVRLRASCSLRREDNFLNPGVAPQKEILDQSDIDATGILKSPLLVAKLADAPNLSPLAWIYDARDGLINDFKTNFNVSTAGVLIASLLGDKYFLDKPTAEVFREGGTFHVLVISGLHITFIGGLALVFVGLFTRKRLPRFVIVCVFLWAYTLAVGANVPVVRAALMFTILLFSEVIYRRGTLLNSLGACGLILLVWRPDDFFTQSFQLTFASVAALVVIAFPLLEKLKAVGDWTLSAETPAPPDVPNWLKRFCETLYWREAVWKIESERHVWSANYFKSSFINWLERSTLQQQILRYVFEAILVSAIVQICLLPLMIIYFHRVSFAGILLNLWVGIIIALESFAAIFAVFLAHINHALAFPFVKITEFFNWLLVAFPRLFTENSWASFRAPHYSGALESFYFLYFLPVLVIAFLLYRWNPFQLTGNENRKTVNDERHFGEFDFSLRNSLLVKSTLAVFAVLLALIVFHPSSAPAPDGRLHVDFLDVGQGDSALITFPDGETMLVDGGGKISRAQMIKREDEGDDEPEIFEPDTQSIGEMVASNFLWSKGYDTVDYILATHGDADHIQGLRDVAKNFSVRAALFGRTPLKNSEFAAVYKVLEKRGTPILTVARGDVLNFGDVKIEVLSPEKTDDENAPSDNNHSVVLRLVFGARKILLTGDIEKGAERELLSASETIQTDVIKVAHHGSSTSSSAEFVAATRAKLAVVSVGRESPFGHPRPEVVERWKSAGARVLTTGENGTISVSTDGRDLQLKTFTGEKIYR